MSAQRRHFGCAVPFGGATEDPIPVLMTEPTAVCRVVRPLWLFPDSEEYLLYHIDEDAFEQLIAFVRTQTHVDEYARQLAPYYDSIQRFLRDGQLHLDRAAIMDELTMHPELLPAIATIFTTRSSLQRKNSAAQQR